MVPVTMLLSLERTKHPLVLPQTYSHVGTSLLDTKEAKIEKCNGRTESLLSYGRLPTEKLATLEKQKGFKPGDGGVKVSQLPLFCLTCSLGAQEVLALRLVRIDGGDGHVVGRVDLQVLQDVAGLVVVQDVLMWKTQTQSVGELKKQTWGIYIPATGSKVCISHVPSAPAGRSQEPKPPLWESSRSTCADGFCLHIGSCSLPFCSSQCGRGPRRGLRDPRWL